MTLTRWQQLYDNRDIIYLDWFNNFLTVPVFAEHYGITEALATLLIETGRATQ